LIAQHGRVQGSKKFEVDEVMEKDNRTVVNVLRKYLSVHAIRPGESSVLDIGADEEELEMLGILGFTHVTASNIGGYKGHIALDAEAIALDDNSYDVVFTHAVIHHCRSPHKAVLEMARVARRHVVFIEPNESAFLRLLVQLRFSYPYEIAAVEGNNYEFGGVRNTPVPNFIFRWGKRELRKTIHAGFPERQWRVEGYPYWDFYVNEYDIEMRRETRLGVFSKVFGTTNFIRLLHGAQKLLNLTSATRSQGNKFLGVISKGPLHPWIEMSEGELRLKRDYSLV
jgi:SAM-dependent methyltransferase